MTMDGMIIISAVTLFAMWIVIISVLIRDPH